MAREIDLRSSDDYVSFTLRAEDLPMAAEEPRGSLVEQALSIARLTSEVMGARNVTPVEFEADPGVETNALGSATVHLRQQFGGIPVFLGNQTVRFGTAKDLQRTQARLSSASQGDPRLTLSAERAAESAVRHLATEPSDDPDPRTVPVNLDSFVGVVTAEFADLPTRPTVLDRGPLEEPIQASLTWLPLRKALRLCWDLTLVISPMEGAYRMLVAADDGSILYSTQLIQAVCTGNVFVVNPHSRRTLVDFPRPWQGYGVLVDGAMPDGPPGWVTEDSTAGYAVWAYAGPNGTPLKGVESGEALVFDPTESDGVEQMVVNAFFGACSMHDYFYLAGFREALGSFQDSGVSATGKPCTRVNVEIRQDPVRGGAHWWPSRIPVLRFGPDSVTDRSTALDMTIVLHEYMHGVTSRLVAQGASTNPFLEAQSRGMSEGWGDYIACALTGEVAAGSWARGTDLGMRRFVYDESFPVGSANFGILAALKPYEIGEVWCATLLEVNRRIGAALAVRLVVDSLRDLPINPGLLDGRDAMLLALQDRRDVGLLDEAAYRASRAGLWAAFAKFGMGVGAFSQGPTLNEIVADLTVPSA